jgi:hypothetical protein
MPDGLFLHRTFFLEGIAYNIRWNNELPRESYLDTDASDTAIGAVLSQVQDGQMKVISYGSGTLNKAERNYCTTTKLL